VFEEYVAKIAPDGEITEDDPKLNLIIPNNLAMPI
jgi:hypothetical protein